MYDDYKYKAQKTALTAISILLSSIVCFVTFLIGVSDGIFQADNFFHLCFGIFGGPVIGAAFSNVVFQAYYFCCCKDDNAKKNKMKIKEEKKEESKKTNSLKMTKNLDLIKNVSNELDLKIEELIDYTIKENIIKPDKIEEWKNYLRNTLSDKNNIPFIEELIRCLGYARELSGPLLLDVLKEKEDYFDDLLLEFSIKENLEEVLNNPNKIVGKHLKR